MTGTPAERDHTCRACRSIAEADQPLMVWQNELWVLRHMGPPYPALGWMVLHSRRHAPAFTALTPAELADLGPTLSRAAEAIVAATGARRVYLASMTEDTPHFHAHLVPRYEDGPKGWAVFQLKDQSMLAPPEISDAAVAALVADVANRLRSADA